MIRYYTYNNQGIVTVHKYLFTAIIKAKFQALIMGVNSYVDICNNHEIKTSSYRSIKYYKGWTPFKGYI